MHSPIAATALLESIPRSPIHPKAAARFPAAVRALLQEMDLLQVVAQTAEHVARFGPGESAAEPLANLRNSLRRWKE